MGVNINNRSARYNYHIHDKYIAGIVLLGSEVKAIRQGKVSMNDAYCFFSKEEIWIKNFHISEYDSATIEPHNPGREKKLLLKKRELKKLFRQQKEKNFSIIPLTVIEKNRYIKLEIATAKGKKRYDKREAIKKRDVEKLIDF